MTRRLTRRQLLIAGAAGGAGLAGAAGLAGWHGQPAGPASGSAASPSAPLPPLPAAVAGLPAAQHAWDPVLRRDEHHNTVAPRHHRLLLLGVAAAPTPARVRHLEAALRRLETRWPWRPGGLLHVLGWGPGYFRRYTGHDSPIPDPRPLAAEETPTLDDYDACLHLAGDDPRAVEMATRALTGHPATPALAGLSLTEVFAVHEVRTGFVGTGLPAAHQQVSGVPARRPVDPHAPLYMGYASGYRRNQATEADVTTAAGPFAGGTTMHVSRVRLRLDSWYDLLDADQRAARMFAPPIRDADVAGFTDTAPTHADTLDATATRYGVVGHLQAAAGARRHGRPRILRRDFNTDDGGTAGLHFVALQRSIADFEATRQAMNAAAAPYDNPAITAEVNNGIQEFMLVANRANYAVPPRARRSFPLLDAQAEALT